MDATDAAFLSYTSLKYETKARNSFRGVETLPTGDEFAFVVTVSQVEAAAPGLVGATSETTVDTIRGRLEYVISTESVPDDVRQELEALAYLGRLIAAAEWRPLWGPVAEVNFLRVTVDWAMDKVTGEARNAAMTRIIDRIGPGSGKGVMSVLKNLEDIKSGLDLGDELEGLLRELDALEECAKNPTNPLTRQAHQANPAERQRVLDEIAAARVDVIANTVVMQVSVLNKVIARYGPKWLGYAIGPGSAWAKKTLQELNRERIDEVSRGIPKCGYHIDRAGSGSRVWGDKCGGIDGQWLLHGTYSRAGFNGTQEWIITLNESSMRGDYIYNDDQVGVQLGITIKTTGVAVGTVAASIDANGALRMLLKETTHTYTVTTKGGKGQDQNAPLQSFDVVWEPAGAAC
jgi:hypothetical protein